MASKLVECRDCKEKVSKSAKTCPHCGVDNPARGKKGGWKGWIGLAIVGIVIWAIARSPEEDQVGRESDESAAPSRISEAAVLSKPVISNVTFQEVDRLFGVSGSLSDLQKEERWKQYNGLCVEWTGTLEHLDSAMFGGFNIGMKHLRATFTYDVLVHAPESLKETLMSWQLGNRYTYRGTLKNYGVLLPISMDWGCE